MLEYNDYCCDSLVLKRALGLTKKDALNPGELAQVVLGGRVCSKHGVNLMATDDKRNELPDVLEALALTTDTLLDNAVARMTGPEALELTTEQTTTLNDAVNRSRQDVQFLYHWAGRMAQGVQPGIYDA